MDNLILILSELLDVIDDANITTKEDLHNEIQKANEELKERNRLKEEELLQKFKDNKLFQRLNKRNK